MFERLVEIATAQIEEREANRRQAQSEANSHVGAMESRYDMFKEDAQYLSAGYEQRIRTLSEQRTRLAALGRKGRIRPTLTEGALVEVFNASGNRVRLVIAEITLDEMHTPKGRIEAGGGEWTVVTPKSGEGGALVCCLTNTIACQRPFLVTEHIVFMAYNSWIENVIITCCL